MHALELSHLDEGWTIITKLETVNSNYGKTPQVTGDLLCRYNISRRRYTGGKADIRYEKTVMSYEKRCNFNSSSRDTTLTYITRTNSGNADTALRMSIN
jgi:hypothetical protein